MDDRPTLPDPDKHLPAINPPSSREKGSKKSTRRKARPGQEHGPERERKGDQVPNVERLLGMLMQLNGMVLAGWLSPTKANVIQRNLRTVLDAKLKLAGGRDQAAVSEDFVTICRQHPAVLNTLADFLTDAQVEWILGQLREEDGDEDQQA